MCLTNFHQRNHFGEGRSCLLSNDSSTEFSNSISVAKRHTQSKRARVPVACQTPGRNALHNDSSFDVCLFLQDHYSHVTSDVELFRSSTFIVCRVAFHKNLGRGLSAQIVALKKFCNGCGPVLLHGGSCFCFFQNGHGRAHLLCCRHSVMSHRICGQQFDFGHVEKQTLQ